MLMKTEIRREKKIERATMKKHNVIEKSHSVARIFLKSDIYKNAKSVMLYMPLGNEVCTSEIIEDALLMSKNVLVPVTDKETFEIVAHRITEKTQFEKGVFSLDEPKEKEVFDRRKIDTIIVPGIAFGKDGTRIGFGKGCYDRFLQDSFALKIGFCYDFQLCENIEIDPFDIKMDYIVTENELINCIKWEEQE